MKKRVYTNYEAEKFLSKNKIPVSESQLVKRLSEIKIKPPLVLKIISQDALHKTEINGVRIVKDIHQLEKSYNDLMRISKSKNLRLEGIMVQKFVEGEQLIIGIKKDPVFNHVILFGLGGIFTEVLNDTSIRKCPIKKSDVKDMISELKSSRIFKEFRGKKLNTKFLEETLVNVSKIPSKNKKILELDINPFILNEKSGLVVDSRIIFDN